MNASSFPATITFGGPSPAAFTNIALNGWAFPPGVDTTPPATPVAPSLRPEDDSGRPGDGLTNVARPRLTGNTEPGATVYLLDDAGRVVGTTTVGADGLYAVRPDSPLAEGTRMPSASGSATWRGTGAA